MIEKTLNIFTIILVISLVIEANPSYSQEINIESYMNSWKDNYKHLHASPELSLQEKETSEFLLNKIKKLSYVIRKDPNGYGFVAIMQNGIGPTIMYRTDMDALPIKEKTALPFASNVVIKGEDGTDIPVMHACGHDMHMSIWLGVAEYLSNHKELWSGTLVLVAQQAEEIGQGALKLLDWGIYKMMDKVDYALAYHVSPTLPVGKIGLNSGYIMANVDMVDITVFGKGGHGASPHTAIDPILLASRLILDFQTIISRELSPIDPAVITVGAIHGGTKGNIIPDSVNLSLTVRSFYPAVRRQLLDAITLKCNAAAQGAGLSENKMPRITIRNEKVPALYNDPILVDKLNYIFRDTSESKTVVQTKPLMVGEDFAYYGLTDEKVPIAMIWLGSVEQSKYDEYQASGENLPSLHSSEYYPHLDGTLSEGVEKMVQAITGLMAVRNGRQYMDQRK